MASDVPYQSEREASAAARAVIPPEPGWSILSQEQRAELLHRVLAESGVETSEYEDGQAWWLGNWSDPLVAVVARWVRAAYVAGKAAGPDGAVTEWGVRYEHRPELFPGDPPEARVDRGADRETAERMMAGTPHREKHADDTLVRREIGPWKEVPDA